MTACLVYVTVSDPVEAERIGRTIVEEKLAACANILPGMRSIYRWQGEIEQANETVLLLKTEQYLSEEVIMRVMSLHSATTPCVLVLPVEAGNPDFLGWIENEVRPQVG